MKETDTFGARSGTHTVTVQLGEMYDEMRDKMQESLAKFLRRGSGWRLKSIIGLEIGIAKFHPMEGAGYSKLPPFIAKKKAVINMKNEECKEKCGKCDQCEESKMCFKWAVTRALNPVDSKPERVTKELCEQAKKYNWEGITFPTKVKDISVWEKNNGISVNVFGYDTDEKKIYTIRLCDIGSSVMIDDNGQVVPTNGRDKFINLFLHDDKHFCVIKDLSRLVSFQFSNKGHGKDICL